MPHRRDAKAAEKGTFSLIPFARSDIRKILLVRNDNIGDVVCTLPCIEAVRRNFPRAYIAVLVCRLAEEIVAGNPYVDKVYVYDKAKHGRYGFILTAWWKQFGVLRDIRDEHFDLAVGIRSEFSRSQAWLVYASGAAYRLGMQPAEKDKRYSFFYNIYVDALKERVHEVERSLHVLRRIGVDIDEKKLILTLCDDNYAKADEFLSKFRILGGEPLVCINFSRRLEERRYWKDSNYLKVVELLSEKGLRTVFTTGPAEVRHVRALLKDSAGVPLFCSESLKDFAAVIERSDVFVTLQGGGMHVAAAAGTPTVALFGEHPDVWAPWGEGHVVLRKGDDANLIGPDDVVAAVQDVLARQREAKPGRRKDWG